MRIFSYEELDELGEGLIRQYLGKEAERTCCVDIEGFVTDFLKLPLLYRSFAEEDSDKIGFIADGSTPLCVYENGEIKNRIYPRGTIVIERCLRREHESGRPALHHQPRVRPLHHGQGGSLCCFPQRV
jgi:hypothetical protein